MEEYYNEKNERIPDPETAPIVKLIFEKFLETASSSKVARFLRENKIKRPCYYNAIKYGYNKSYIAINLITGITLVIVIFYSMQPIGIMRSSDGGAKLLYNNLKLFLTTGVCIVIYLASMYISTKIYTKKEIAN